MAIFSKYRIVNKGDIKFNNSTNKAIYIDVVKNNDTLRVYNVHFESLHIKPDIEELSEEDTEHLVKRIGSRFEKQQDQVLKVIKHQKECKYRKMVVGDFNNTAYSYIYTQFKKAGFQDAFELAGNGFGRTFNFKFFPLRIDYVLVSEALNVIEFKNYNQKYSDHYPIKSVVGW